MSNEQNATRTMPRSRNQSKSAENLRCQRNLFMYFQLTCSVLIYLTVKITNKFVGIRIPIGRQRTTGSALHLRRPNAGMPFVSPPRNNRVCLGSRHHNNQPSGVPRGRVRGVQTPPLNLQKNFVLCVCKIYSPFPALVFIKSKILYRKTLEIVR